MSTSTHPKTINLAVLALGGQGGGVLVDWIVNLAESGGWTAQSTSVAGVAQRTGATIYYIELVEPTPGREPVMALVPIPGEVDILIAAELMEAGRAVERGLVTPDRTTVIASSHRTYAVTEKMVPGDGLANAPAVLQIVQDNAQRLIADDLQALAMRCGSVISASLFGALAGSGALPFDISAFERVVEQSGVGVKASIRALREAAALAQSGNQPPKLSGTPMLTPARALPARAASAALQSLLDRIRRDFAPPVWPWLGEGLARVVDWQDLDYGSEYLDRVHAVAQHDHADHAYELGIEAARWIAVAMSYDDLIRVADLKTRAERFERIRTEIGASDDDVTGSVEYFHPRLEEAMGVLPCKLAALVDRSPHLKAWLHRRLDRGHHINTQSLRGYVPLRVLAGLARWRRGNQRHAHETAHLQAWLDVVTKLAPDNYALAVEVLRLRRLIKGYSDTHTRGESKYDLLLQAAQQPPVGPGAAQQLAQWRELALREVEPDRLRTAIQSARPAGMTGTATAA